MKCPKCKSESGDDWSQCGGSCPMPMSPNYVPDRIAFGKNLDMQDQDGRIIWRISGNVPPNIVALLREIEKRYNK